MTWNGIEKYVSAELGGIHDWYIAKSGARTKRLDLRELEVGSETVPGLQYIANDLDDAKV